MEILELKFWRNIQSDNLRKINTIFYGLSYQNLTKSTMTHDKANNNNNRKQKIMPSLVIMLKIATSHIIDAC